MNNDLICNSCGSKFSHTHFHTCKPVSPSVIYIIEEYKTCDDDYDIVTFETTEEKAKETVQKLTEKAFKCDHCEGTNKYSFRKLTEGLPGDWHK